jgi:hypothetical protein
LHAALRARLHPRHWAAGLALRHTSK